jgi:NADH-quinone oxidoreductase subunit K
MNLAIGLPHYLFVAGMLFVLGFFGVLLRRNTLVIFMSLELMLTASILALAAFSRFNSTAETPLYSGNVFVLFIIAIAACEVAVGLAIIVALWRRRQTVDVAELAEMKH